MNSIIEDQTISKVLTQLHQEAKGELLKIFYSLRKGIFRKLKPEDMEQTYIALTPDQGKLVYQLARSNNAKNIIEFGSSFGISTLYLGAAAKDNGGKVISTEILPSKHSVAINNINSAGINDFVEIRLGDAMETLKEVPDQIDFLLLDGWNNLYLPLLKMLEPKFKSGCIIYSDNINFSSSGEFVGYLKNRPKHYINTPLKTKKGGAAFTTYIK